MSRPFNIFTAGFCIAGALATSITGDVGTCVLLTLLGTLNLYLGYRDEQT